MKETQSPRYSLTSPAPGHYEAKDNRTGVYVTFQEKKFDETQQWYHPVDSSLTPAKLDSICDDLEGWLKWHHKDLMTEDTYYKITVSDDGSTVKFIRQGTPDKPGDPHIEITFPAETYKKTIAVRLGQMAKFLKESARDWHEGPAGNF